MLRSRRWLLLGVGVGYGALLGAPLFRILGESSVSEFSSYGAVAKSPLLVPILVNTLTISITTTALAVVLAYVYALAMWRAGRLGRLVLVAFILLPFWTGVLVKNFAWAVLFQENGVVSHVLGTLGVPGASILHTRLAVIIGMTHYVLPYAVLPLYASLSSINRQLEQSALSLGASSFGAFRHIVFPLTLPGIYAGALLVFLTCLGFFITPVILGGPTEQMVANLVALYALTEVDFGAASALAVMITVAVVILVIAYQRLPKVSQYALE